MHCGSANRSAMRRKSSGGTSVSASMNTSHSPVATAAPVFRARPTFRSGSWTTLAPWPTATDAVASVLSLSTTMTSTAWSEAPLRAASIAASVAGRYACSLHAGTMTEKDKGDCPKNDHQRRRQHPTIDDLPPPFRGHLPSLPVNPVVSQLIYRPFASRHHQHHSTHGCGIDAQHAAPGWRASAVMSDDVAAGAVFGEQRVTEAPRVEGS